MSVLDWRLWDHLERLDRKVGIKDALKDPKNRQRSARWWPWSFFGFCISPAVAVVLTVVDHDLSGIFVPLPCCWG
jgi:hypothetical protein